MGAIGPWLGFIVFWAVWLPGLVFTARRRYQTVRPELICTNFKHGYHHSTACFRPRWTYSECTSVDSPTEAYWLALGEGAIWFFTWPAIWMSRLLTVRTPLTPPEESIMKESLRAARKEQEQLADRMEKKILGTGTE